jgi:pimeloyl-ACP methyl ester carboxylesterase
LGELNMLTGQGLYLSGVVCVGGAVLAITRERLKEVVTEEPNLSDIILKAFIARRSWGMRTGLGLRIIGHAGIDTGGRWRERLGEVSAPALVIHGTEDPMFPYGNAVALAKEVPGARLLALERVGHEVPPRDLWDVVVPAILRHTASAP